MGNCVKREFGIENINDEIGSEKINEMLNKIKYMKESLHSDINLSYKLSELNDKLHCDKICVTSPEKEHMKYNLDDLFFNFENMTIESFDLQNQELIPNEDLKVKKDSVLLLDKNSQILNNESIDDDKSVSLIKFRKTSSDCLYENSNSFLEDFEINCEKIRT
jgi:hypothetical protein